MTSNSPKVIIAGAGPGDAGLITIKAAKFLEKADYVLVDRLVNPEIIQLYANPKAQIIYVGKQGGKESISQEAINALVVEYGQKDGLTVRLKGGDIAFFSQVIFEIRALNEQNIPFEIVPGVTSVSGASASLKTPLTAREISRGVRILTYHDGEHFTSVEWRNMADTTDTLVFYMSSKALPELVHNLRQYAYHDKTIAVIEQATTPQERVLLSSIFGFENDLADTIIVQPALVIIGEVMKLYDGKSQAKEKTISFFKEH
jgi:uroporphyrin-III C-methyltransferase / precorrin-2 dehydrogenase / sirohydrochlorin ferrochelatase